MKVEIKKLKITKSILEQIIPYQINTNDEVLGWCIVDDKQWMVLHNTTTNLLNKSPIINSVKLLDNWERVTPDEVVLFYYVKLFYDTGYRVHCFERNLDSAKDFIKRLENVSKDCKTKGQFYV